MKKSKNLSGIGALLFVLWILVSFVGIIYFADKNNTIFAGIFGQVFFGVGLITFFIYKEKFGIVFSLVGGVILVGAGINILGNEEIKNFFNEKCLPIMASLVFPTVGFIIITVTKYKNVKKSQRCTLIASATCVELKKTRSDKGNTLYCPIWSYYMGTETYTYCDNVYSNVGIPNINDTITIYVNPDDYSDAYVKNPKQQIILYIIGFGFLILGSFLTYVVLKDIIA